MATVYGRQGKSNGFTIDYPSHASQGSYATFGSIAAFDYLDITFQQPAGLVISKGNTGTGPGNSTGGQARNGYFKIPTGEGGIYRVKGSICANIPHKRVGLRLFKQTPTGTTTLLADLENDMPATSGAYPNNAMAHTKVYQCDTMAQINALEEVFMQVLLVYGEPSPAGVVRIQGGPERNYFEIQKI